MGKKERLLDSQHVYRGRAIHVRVDSVVKPNDTKTTREVVEHVDCVVILPIDSQGQHPAGAPVPSCCEQGDAGASRGEHRPGRDSGRGSHPRATGRDRLQAGQAGETGRILRCAGVLHGVPALLPGDSAWRRARSRLKTPMRSRWCRSVPLMSRASSPRARYATRRQ